MDVRCFLPWACPQHLVQYLHTTRVIKRRQLANIQSTRPKLHTSRAVGGLAGEDSSSPPPSRGSPSLSFPVCRPGSAQAERERCSGTRGGTCGTWRSARARAWAASSSASTAAPATPSASASPPPCPSTTRSRSSPAPSPAAPTTTPSERTGQGRHWRE